MGDFVLESFRAFRPSFKPRIMLRAAWAGKNAIAPLGLPMTRCAMFMRPLLNLADAEDGAQEQNTARTF